MKNEGLLFLLRWALYMMFTALMIWLALPSILFLGGVFFDDRVCRNELIESIELQNSPDRVVLFQRDCGVTTSFSTQVSIIKKGQKLPNKSGNIFIADRNHGKAPGGRLGGPEVRVELLSDDKILLKYHPMARVFKRETGRGDFKITYGRL